MLTIFVVVYLWGAFMDGMFAGHLPYLTAEDLRWRCATAALQAIIRPPLIGIFATASLIVVASIALGGNSWRRAELSVIEDVEEAFGPLNDWILSVGGGIFEWKE